MNELCDKIIKAAKFITNEMLANAWQETEYHLHACHTNYGAHIEIY